MGACSAYCNRVRKRIVRRRHLNPSNKAPDTRLHRCLGTTDLVCYGIASMIGCTIYALTGSVARTRAGPLTFLAYVIAGIVAMPNSLAYAELACLIPKAGSIYVYAFALLSELLAFFAGWAVLLEYIMGMSTIGRSSSSIVDIMADKKIGQFFTDTFGKLNAHAPLLADYLDPLSALFIIGMAAITCTGMKSGTMFNNLMVLLNLAVLTILTIFMFIYAEPANLSKPAPPDYKPVGPALDRSNPTWLPFGVSGLVAGAATCFNGFIGFDVISTCAEETVHPNRSLPRANIIAVAAVTLILSLCSLALTMYAPWFELDPGTAFQSAMLASKAGTEQLRKGMFYFVGVGAFVSLLSSLLGNVVAASRILYGMAEDGLVFPCFKYLLPWKAPVVATALVTFLASAMSMIFSIESMADFLSLGVLAAYSLASIAVMKYRYCAESLEENDNFDSDSEIERSDVGIKDSSSETDSQVQLERACDHLNDYWVERLPTSVLIFVGKQKHGRLPMIGLAGFIVCGALFVTCLAGLTHAHSAGTILRSIFIVFFALLMAGLVVFMSAFRQRNDMDPEQFRLPMVPALPCITILLNIILISQLTWITWARFAIWLVIGALVYFGYSVNFANTPGKEKNKKNALEDSKTPLSPSDNGQKNYGYID